MKRYSGLFVAALAAVTPVAWQQAQADTYLRQVMRTAPMVIYGQSMPGKVDTATSWLSAERAYQDHGDGTASLYLASDSTLYLINHDEKSVYQLDLTKGVDISQLLGAALPDTNAEGKPLTAAEKKDQEQQKQQMSLMAEAMMKSAKIHVEATGAQKRIGSWSTEQYKVDISMATMESKGELWATPVAPVAYQAYQRLAYSQMAMAPGFEALLSEISKIKGITVYSKNTMKIMGVDVDVETELLEMKSSAAPDGIYELPKGYVVKTAQ
jgi:hypothetical protein